MRQTTLEVLENIFSKQRLKWWIDLADGDHERALVLHRRNTMVAAVLFPDLQYVEIALRNALDRALRDRFRPDWLSHKRFSKWKSIPKGQELAQETYGVSPPSRDQILVCFSFRFWSNLCENSSLRSAILRAFRSGTDLAELQSNLEALVALRNAMAHHEPIIDGTRPGKSLKNDLAAMDAILKSIDLQAADWLRNNSLIRQLVDAGHTACVDSDKPKLLLHVP